MLVVRWRQVFLDARKRTDLSYQPFNAVRVSEGQKTVRVVCSEGLGGAEAI